MAEIDGCRVHADRPVSGPHDLCHKCVQRIDAATKRLLEDRSPTRLQAQTLLNMGRPLAVSLERWPDLLVLIRSARDEHKSVPVPGAERPVAEVVPLPQPVAASSLADLVAELRARADLAELALDLRRDDYRDSLVKRLAEQACHGVEGAAGETALAVVAEELTAALAAASARLEAVVVQQERPFVLDDEVQDG